MDDPQKCYISSLVSLHSHCWDEQCAVYHADSGDTHLLSKLDLTVLQQIDGQPASPSCLLSKVEHLFDGNACQYINALLTHFETLGLVEVVDSKLSS